MVCNEYVAIVAFMFMAMQYYITDSQSVKDTDQPGSDYCDISDTNGLLRHLLQGSFVVCRSHPCNEKEHPVVTRDVQYYMYTKDTNDTPLVISNGDVDRLNRSDYKADKLSVFIIHGWFSNYLASVNKILKNAILREEDVNVFVVDWRKQANQIYFRKDLLSFACRVKFSVDITLYAMFSCCSQMYSKKIGKIVGTFIKGMMETFDIDPSKFLLIGHGVGAHVAGCAGSRIKTSGSEPIETIIGLDPSWYGVSTSDVDSRLDPSDGKYVQVIHTSSLGIQRPLGHSDYYPNGGLNQGPCVIGNLMCSHHMSFYYYAESIGSSEFVAHQCSNIVQYKNGKCFAHHRSIMGRLKIDTEATKRYYLFTNKESPYAKGDPQGLKSSSPVSTASVINLISKGVMKYITVRMKVLAAH